METSPYDLVIVETERIARIKGYKGEEIRIPALRLEKLEGIEVPAYMASIEYQIALPRLGESLPVRAMEVFFSGLEGFKASVEYQYYIDVVYFAYKVFRETPTLLISFQDPLVGSTSTGLVDYEVFLPRRGVIPIPPALYINYLPLADLVPSIIYEIELGGIGSREGGKGVSEAGVKMAVPPVQAVQVSVRAGAPSSRAASLSIPLPSVESSLLETVWKHIEESDLFKVARVVGGRPLIIVAYRDNSYKRGEYEYIETLKRILREVYRVRVGGLPRPRHVTRLNDLVRIYDLEAGEHIYVVDLRGDLEPASYSSIEVGNYLEDRVRELYSQGYGYLVLYGDVDVLGRRIWEAYGNIHCINCREPYTGPSSEWEPEIRNIIRLMWGAGESNMCEFKNLDLYTMCLEDKYYRAVEAALADSHIQLILRPSPGEKESIEHYMLKAAAASHLVGAVVEHLEGQGISEEEAIWRALDGVKVEARVGETYIDVYLDFPPFERVAVEVETLYGSVNPAQRIVDTVEARAELIRGGMIDRLWILVPNPQLTIFLPEILAACRWISRKYRDIADRIELVALKIEHGAGEEPQNSSRVGLIKILNIGELEKMGH